MSKYYFSALAFFFIFGCADRIPPQKTDVVNPNKMENLRVKVNESIEIVLDEASTAGYVWNYEVSEDGVISMTESYDDPMKRAADTIPPPVGGFSKKIFKINGLKSGKVKLRFYQVRPWELNEAPIKEKFFIVKVVE